MVLSVRWEGERLGGREEGKERKGIGGRWLGQRNGMEWSGVVNDTGRRE